MSRASGSVCSDGAAPARFKPATPRGKPAAHVAGPFDVVPVGERNHGFGSVLITGLLVVYPAFATVAAIVVGLSLSSGGA